MFHTPAIFTPCRPLSLASTCWLRGHVPMFAYTPSTRHLNVPILKNVHLPHTPTMPPRLRTTQNKRGKPVGLPLLVS